MACNPSKRHMEIYKLGQEFINDPKVKKMFDSPDNLVIKKHVQLFGFKPTDWKAWQPTKADIRKFKGELKYLKKWVNKGKLTGVFARNLYTTSGIARRNPLLGDYYDKLLRTQHELKGRQHVNEQQFNKVLESLSKMSVRVGAEETTVNMKKVNKRINKLENDIQRLEIEVNQGKAQPETLAAKMSELDTFLSKGEGKVYKRFIEYIENKESGLRSIPEIVEISKERKGKHLTEKNIKTIKDAIRRSNLNDVNMENAVIDYIQLMHEAYNTLNKGVNAYIDAVQSGMIAKGITNTTQLQEIRTKLTEKLLPDEKAGYYPHFRYDLNVEFLDGLMPKLQKLSVDSNIGSSPSAKGFINNVDLMKAAMDDINLYLSKRIKPRTKDLDNKLYSMNFPVIVKRYVDEINRFNFVAHSQKYTREVLQDAIKTFKKGGDLEGYGSQFVEMVKEMNFAHLGTKEITNPEWTNLSRTLLNLEFVSKLGFNIRSGAKNATQGLLNLVEFGPMFMYRSYQFYKDPKMKTLVERSMLESGLGFSDTAPDLVDIAKGKPFKQTIKLAGDEITFTKPSKLGEFADLSGKLAQKSGILMQGIENFNRKSTYKLGFYKMYESLLRNTDYKMMLNQSPKYLEKGISDAEFISHVTKKAKNYAERMTTLLHFDYSSVSKSQLLRSDIGQFMFQFQHYGMKFGEYNFGLLRNAKHGIMSGDVFGSEVGKAFRLGTAYMAVPALLSALTKNDWFRLIQHDSAQRISQWWNFFTGDKEDIEKVTYGRGAIGALVGAPVFSDFLALGELAELWDLDEESFTRLLVGYNDMTSVSGDQKIRKLLNILNVQLGRSVYNTGDLVFDGHMGRGLMFELGLFPTANAVGYQESLINTTAKTLPQDLLDALDAFEEHRTAARSTAAPKTRFTR